MRVAVAVEAGPVGAARLLHRNKTLSARLSPHLRPPMLSKFDLVLIAASVAAAVGFIERGNNIVIDLPDPPVLAPYRPATSCSEDERGGANDVVFLEGGIASGMRGPRTAAERTPASSDCVTN